MAKSGNDWRSGGSSRSRRPVSDKSAEAAAPPAKTPAKPAERSDWRQKKLGQEDPSRAAALKGKDYLRRRDQTQRQKTFRHRLKVGGWTGLAVLLLAVLVVYLLFLPKQVTLVRVIVTDYQAPLPPNAYALEDGRMIDSLETTNNQSIRILKKMDVVPPHAEFLQGFNHLLKEIKPGGPGKKTYMIYLSAHGVVNEEGEPCLLLGDMDPLNSEEWLPLAAVIKEMNSIEQLKAPEIIKVLILDSGRVSELWDAGIFYNGFADALARTVQREKVKNLFVLHSCSPGERNGSGPELNGSAFGYYVSRGLNGAADGAVDLRQDNTISLQELYVYVRARVNTWSTNYRGVAQNPQLIPAVESNTKIPLTYRRARLTELPEVFDSEPIENSQLLDDLWLSHEKLRNDVKPYRYDPVGWAALQEDLIRLETLLVAGDAYNDKFHLLEADLTNRLREFNSPQRLDAVEPINLPLSEQLHGFSMPQSRVRQLETYLAKQAAGIPHNIEEGPPPAPNSYLEACYVAWHWLQDPDAGDLTYARLNAAQDMIDKAPRLVAPAEPIEGHYLRMLHAKLDWVDQPGLPVPLLGSIVRQSLQARDAAERAASPPDERTIYWLHDTVDQADQQRRLAEDRLFVGSKDDALTAQQMLAEAGRNSEEGLYGQALADAKELSAAYALRDLAWTDMRYLAGWTLTQMRADLAADSSAEQGELKAATSNLAETLTALLTKSHELGKALDKGLPVPAIRSLRQEVEKAHGEITKDYRDRAGDLTYRVSLDSKSVPQFFAALRLPIYTGTHRNELRRKLMVYLTPSTGSRENVETIEKPAEILKAFQRIQAQKPPDSQYLAAVAGLSEHPALTMVNPEKIGFPDAVTWTAPRRVAPSTESDVDTERARLAAIESLGLQGADLRIQLNATLTGPENRGNLSRLYSQTQGKLRDEFQQNPLDIRNGVSIADRLSRAIGPLMSQTLANSIGKANTDPTLALRRTDRYFQCLWLADRTMNDFWGPRPDPQQRTMGSSQQPYFDIVARSLLRNSDKLLPEAHFRRYHDQPLEQKRTQLVNVATGSVTPAGNQIDAPPQSEEVMLTGTIQSKPFLPEGLAAIYLTSHSGQVFPFKFSSQTRRRFGFDVGATPKSGSINNSVLTLTAAGSASDLKPLQQFRSLLLRSYFHGHDLFDEIPVQSAVDNPEVFVTNYEPIRTPEVLVVGDVQQIPPVMFVFDCSGSMHRLQKTSEGVRPRIEWARNRLISILEKKMPNGSFNVGLMLYGHRVGWNFPKANGFRFNQNMIRPNVAQQGLNPNLDVETIHPIALLNKRSRDSMIDQLKIAEPWGQTPLYFSIKKALEQFAIDNVNPDARAQIIVITDGGNDVDILGGNLDTSANDIVDMFRDHKKTRIDIVAFDFEEKDLVKHKPPLTSIVETYGGKLHAVTEPSDLERAIDGLLSPITYHVQPLADNNRYPDATKPLGETWLLNSWNLAEVERNPQAARYKVDMFGAQRQPANADNLELLGGESLIMEYDQSSGDNYLKHLEYKPKEFGIGDTRLTDLAVSNNDRTRQFKVTSFVPKRFGESLQFDIAIQHFQFWPFTPRPRRMWVEIRPLGGSSAGSDPLVFNFFDVAFVQGKPIPVYRYTVPKWPKTSQMAEVKVWFLMQELAPLHQEKLPINDTNSLEITSDTLRQQIPGSKFSARIVARSDQSAYRVYVTETIGTGGQMHQTCLDISPRPTKVVHNYQGGKAVHEFVYEGTGEMTNPLLKLWSRRSIEDAAVVIPDMRTSPMRIEVPEQRID